MGGYTIWYCHYNSNTKNFDGLEWVVDGECGRKTFPGSMPECLARRLYEEGLDEVPSIGFCDGCVGEERYCKKR